MTLAKSKALSNHEVVTLAVHLLGGETQRIDTEDIAVNRWSANGSAGGERFTGLEIGTTLQATWG